MAAKPEAKINTRMKTATNLLIHSNVQAHRVEVKSGLGWPDWLLFTDGPNPCVMIESKWVYSWANPLGRWEPHQRSFARHKLEIGIPFYLLIGDADRTVLIPAGPHLDQKEVIQVTQGWGTTINPLELLQVLNRPGS